MCNNGITQFLTCHPHTDHSLSAPRSQGNRPLTGTKRHGNFGYSGVNKGVIAYFSLREKCLVTLLTYRRYTNIFIYLSIYLPTCTAWWQRNIGVRNLPRVFTPWCPAETRTRDLLIASSTLYRNTAWIMKLSKNGCNGASLGDHGILTGDRISSLKSHGQALEQECCFAGVPLWCGDMSAISIANG